MDLHSKQLWRKTAFMGVFLALAMICSYIEMLIPFDFGIPGVKLGLTNIVVVLMLYSIGTKEAFCVSVIRIDLLHYRRLLHHTATECYHHMRIFLFKV